MADKNQNKTKKFYGKGKGKYKSKSSGIEEGEFSKDGFNDWNWYADDANLLKDATNLSFNNAVGGYLPDELYDINAGSDWNFTVPGIMTMPYIPTVGISTDFNSPINVAKAKLYTFVRHANSGHANYDSPDLMQYIMSKTSIDGLFWHFARVYACAFQYHQTNRYLPKALIEAMGVNADDIVANLADFRALLNISAVKLNALFIPNVFGYYKRQTWLNTNVFLDSDQPKSQLYVAVPYNAWVFNQTGADTGNLTAERVYKPEIGKLTFSDIKTLLNNLINPLVASEDINIMSGDMLKAYGEEKRVVLPTLPETYSIQFMYSEEVLEQIHNTTFVGDLHSNYTLKVVQSASTGLLEFNPEFNADNFTSSVNGDYGVYPAATQLPFISARKRFDLITKDATPERIIVASRNTVMYNSLATTKTGASTVGSCGSELFLFGDIYVNTCHMNASQILSNKGLARYRVHYLNVFNAGDITSSTGARYYTALMTILSKFDWAPICLFIYAFDNASGSLVYGGRIDINDMNNYTVIVESNLSKLHELALLTEFNITSR